MLVRKKRFLWATGECVYIYIYIFLSVCIYGIEFLLYRDI